MSDLNTSEVSSLSTLGKKVLSKTSQKKLNSNEYNLSDVNNYIGADRKLIINDTYEFWVHDVVLAHSSKFFSELLETKTRKPSKEEQSKLGDVPIIKTYIDVPHPEFFFDILTWLYSKDITRLLPTSDDPDSFLSLLSLGIFLQLSDDFFTSVLKQSDIQLDEKFIAFPLWSRFCFTFEVLGTLVDLMPNNNLLKIQALLSWLKEDNTLPPQQENELINERELELLTSKEFFMVKNFIKTKQLLNDFTLENLYVIKQNYPLLIPALDTDFLCDNFLTKNKAKIHCKVCGKKGNNLQEFITNKCEVKLYHPKNFVSLQRKLGTLKCEHEDCKRKFVINEFPCCHKPAHTEGCLLSDGNHVLVVEAKNDI